MIAYTPEAERQVDDLRRHYEDRERVEAIRALASALDEVERKIERNPAAGWPPRAPILSLPGWDAPG